MLTDAIEVALSKMVKDAYNDHSKKIPNGFPDFARSSQFKELLEAMLDYNRVSFTINFSHNFRNFSVLKINNKFLSKKPNKEAYQFLRYFHLKKRNFPRRQKRWQGSIVGLCLPIRASVLRMMGTHIVLCSSSREF